MDLSSLNIFLVPAMQILLCIVIASLFKLAMKPGGKKTIEPDVAEEVPGEEAAEGTSAVPAVVEATSALAKSDEITVEEDIQMAVESEGSTPHKLSRAQSLDSQLPLDPEADKAVKDFEQKPTTGAFCGCFGRP